MNTEPKETSLVGLKTARLAIFGTGKDAPTKRTFAEWKARGYFPHHKIGKRVFLEVEEEKRALSENPGSESGKTRGHLGSQLERKAETNLRLAKNTNGITTVWAERARHCYLPKDQGQCFAWNDTAQMHTSYGTAGEIKSAANREKFQADAEAAFGEVNSFRHADLLDAVCAAFDLKERAAKDRVRKWVIEGVIRKDTSGKYQLATP